jgi:alkylhydroperoxidase/carboxymuconolactone decarboxylase family protein YurZ
MTLSEHDRRLLRLMTTVVLGEWGALAELRRAAPDGEPDRAWRETVLQAHLFAGFPRVVEAFGVLGAAGGLGAPEPDEVRGELDLPGRGAELFERIYGDHAERVRRFLREGHPDFADWIAGHAYGRVLTRPGLAPDRRELLAVAALAATGQERQLASHARGALRCGATLDEVRAAVELLHEWVESERVARALRVLERFADQRDV